VPQDVTLSLARLPFDGAEPTSDTLAELAALAERLLREPGPGVVIEADFALPDPEARTVMERRVEVVRAILLRRGIEPARLVVRAAGDGPVAPPAASPFVESPD
jgi:outer membrane protein OmpA-like peptidoglycan-associated protein